MYILNVIFKAIAKKEIYKLTRKKFMHKTIYTLTISLILKSVKNFNKNMTIRTFNNTDILLLRDGYKIMLRLYN